MATIKQRIKDAPTIKVLDKGSTLAERMKDSAVSLKEKSETLSNDTATSPEEYAADSLTGFANDTKKEAIHQGTTRFKSTTDKQIQNFKTSRYKRDLEIPQTTTFTSQNQSTHTAKTAKNTAIPKDRMTSRGYPQKRRKLSTKSLSFHKKSRKAFTHATPKRIKSAKHAAKVAHHTSRVSMEASKRAFHTSRIITKSAITFLPKLFTATVSTVKAIIAASKALISALIAGGWVSVIIVVILCLIGFLVNSSFGIFFSGEDTGTGMTLQTAISTINTEYQDQIDDIKNSQTHDILEVSGNRAVWQEVLAIYSVKTTNDSTNPQEVVSMTDEKLELLKSIFWQMNQITWEVAEKSETVVTTTNNDDGTIVESESIVTRKYLYIRIHHQSIEEAMTSYGFSTAQKEEVALLLDPENQELWTQALTGITGTGDQSIVAIAASQIGNVGGQPYWSWYGFPSRVEWCATFVSWCANQAGYIELGIIPKFASCQGQGVPWFKERGQWQDNSYTPQGGDIIFFDWNGDGSSEHVGIVEKSENGYVHTIEGNTSNACKQRRYPLGSGDIMGYGVPMY